MATFNVNQSRQCYVAGKLATTSVTSTDTAGSIAVKGDTAKNHIYFEYMGAGGQVRSDLVNVKNILSIKASDADSMKRPLKRTKIVMDSTVTDSGKPIGGQDYLLKIAIKNYISISDESTYNKIAMVHAYSGMTASEFYKTMAMSLVYNFSREVYPFFKFYLETGGTSASTVGTLVEVNNTTKVSSLTGTYTGIVLEEVEQDWRLGTFRQVPVNYDILADTIMYNGDYRVWNTATTVASTSYVENGKAMADLEYFLMGERGDQYRDVGFPHNIKTKYLVDPTQKYNTIDIHYAFTDSNEGVQKSERTITLMIPKAAGTNSVGNKLTNDIITAINSKSGLSVSKLDASA